MAANPRRVRLITFKTDQVFSKVQSSVRKAWDKYALEVQAQIRQKINTAFPPSSTPGTPPHRRSGFLHDNVKVVRKGNGLVVRVPQYGVWLEGGTGKMLARPFIRDTVLGRDKKKAVKRVAVLTKRFNALAKSGL